MQLGQLQPIIPNQSKTAVTSGCSGVTVIIHLWNFLNINITTNIKILKSTSKIQQHVYYWCQITMATENLPPGVTRIQWQTVCFGPSK